LAVTLPIATFSIMADLKHLLILEQFDQNNKMM